MTTTEIERLQDLVSNLRRDLCNALMQSRRKDTVIEKCKEVLRSIIGDRKPEHFEHAGPGCIAGEFDIRDVQLSCDALSAIAALSEKEGEK